MNWNLEAKRRVAETGPQGWTRPDIANGAPPSACDGRLAP